jgi:hypothetical protein
MVVTMGIFDIIGKAIDILNPENAYNNGFRDGKEGKSRKYFSPTNDLLKNVREAYNRGYDDGRQQNLIDKLGK